MEGYLIVTAIVLLIIQWAAANKMQEIAEDKGHTDRYWAWCFWLPLAGFAMVIALPDLKARPEKAPAVQKTAPEKVDHFAESQETYTQAVQAFENGDYYQAERLFYLVQDFRDSKDRALAAWQEAQRQVAERQEQARLEAERREAERLERERLEAERLEQERLEQQRREEERLERERIEKERAEQERQEKLRQEREALTKEKAELEAKAAELEAGIDGLPEVVAAKEHAQKIETLEAEKHSLSILHASKRSVLQNQLISLYEATDAVNAKSDDAIRIRRSEIARVRSRIRETEDRLASLK